MFCSKHLGAGPKYVSIPIYSLKKFKPHVIIKIQSIMFKFFTCMIGFQADPTTHDEDMTGVDPNMELTFRVERLKIQSLFKRCAMTVLPLEWLEL